METLSPAVKNCSHNIRSDLHLAASARAAAGLEVVHADIDDLQALGQKPLTFVRQVIALCLAPFLLEIPATTSLFPPDAVLRAQAFLASTTGTVYSNITVFLHPPCFSLHVFDRALPWPYVCCHCLGGCSADARGSLLVRQQVARSLSRRHGHGVPACSPESLFLHNGAGECARLLAQALVRGPNDAVLVPAPGAGLYRACVELQRGACVSYPSAGGLALYL